MTTVATRGERCRTCRMPTQMRCPVTGGGQRDERVASTMAVTTNTIPLRQYSHFVYI